MKFNKIYMRLSLKYDLINKKNTLKPMHVCNAITFLVGRVIALQTRKKQ